LIDFIGIGGQRCGTTWLYEILNEHPEIQMSSEKEIHFFSSNYHYGYEWYNNHFSKVNKIKMGEYSTSYLYDIQSPKRVYEYNKELKIILSIRNPIDRFISHHKHEVIGQRISKNIMNPKNLIKYNPTYIKYGLYYKYLINWFKYFAKEQILIVLFDDIEKCPDSVVKNVYQFLGVDKHYIPNSINKKINASWIAKSNSLIKIQNNIATRARRFGLGLIIDFIKELGLKRSLDNFNSDTNTNIIDMNKDNRKFISKYFIDDIEKLSDLTELELVKIWSI